LIVAWWNKRYETGIALVDAQHKELFWAVNRLAAAFVEGAAKDAAAESLAFLARYTIEHFHAEESHMEEIGYPNLPAHRAEHKALLEKVVVLQRKMEAGGEITLDVTIFLARWLKYHIDKVDLPYARFAQGHAESASAQVNVAKDQDSSAPHPSRND